MFRVLKRMFQWETRMGKFPARVPTRTLFLSALEILERRDTPAVVMPEFLFSSPVGGAKPHSLTGPQGYTPNQIRQAYGFNQVAFNNGTVVGDGSGTTIAIVDAYDDPNISNDLHQFDTTFGLPDPTLTKVNQTGGVAFPQADAGWSGEIALDVEWAHAIAPKAKILLVESTDSSYDNMFAAVSFAAKQPGVVAVSMSFGGSEYSGQTQYDSAFKTPAGHQGVTFIASSGDTGAPASYPSSSPNVISVGGTSLNLSSAGTILSESGWSGSGGGVSSVEPLPAYQKGVVGAGVTRRATPDVAYNADPNTGFPVYDTMNNPANAPWDVLGGTSAAAPQWAGLVAIADQGRSLAGLGSLDGASQALPALYSMPAANFHDITSGKSSGVPKQSATAGYDLVTGRGTPVANLVVGGFLGQTLTPPPSSNNVSSLGVSVANPTMGAGSTNAITVTILDGSGKLVTGFTGTVTLSTSDGQAGQPISYTFTAADKGSHTFNLVLKTAGNQQIQVVDSADFVSASANVSVTPAAPTQLLFDQQPSVVVAGSTITPPLRVKLVDSFGNVASGDNTDQVTLKLGANPGSATLSGTTTVTVANGVAVFNGLSISAVGNGYTLAADSGSFPEVVTSPFNVLAQAPVTSQKARGFQIAVTTNPVVAGTANQITVTAVDRNGNVVPGFTGTINFASTDTQAGLPASYTFTAADNGVHQFAVTLKTAGKQLIQVTDFADFLRSTTQVNVTAGAPTHMVIDQQPSIVVAGSSITPPLRVKLVDDYGNVATGDNTDQVTIKLGANPGSATLGGTTTVTVINGVAVFNGLSISAAGTGYTLAADSGTFSEVNTNPFNVLTTPPVSTQKARGFQITVANLSTVAGAQDQVTITAVDRHGNVASGYTGTVSFASSDVQAGLPASYTFTAADNGTHQFSVTLKTAGRQLIQVTDYTNYLRSGGLLLVTPAAPTHLVLDNQPATVSAGIAISPALKVKLVDDYGNVATNDNTDQVTIKLAANPGSATLGGTTTVTVVRGVATFDNLTVSAVGTGYTLAVDSGSLPELTTTAFNVLTPSSSNTILDFENPSVWRVAGPDYIGPNVARSTSAAHDGANGLDYSDSADWIYRNDPASIVKKGSTVSTWLNFANTADGTASFGFGANRFGTYALVAAPGSNQLQLEITDYSGTKTLATVDQTFQANHWYRLEVSWGTDGKLVGKLYDTDGTTVLQTVSETDQLITSGGLAFNATGSDKYFDTVTSAPILTPITNATHHLAQVGILPAVNYSPVSFAISDANLAYMIQAILQGGIPNGGGRQG